MKTNVIIMKITDGFHVIDKIIGKKVNDQYEYDPEHDWNCHVFYYLGIDGKKYINFNGSEYVGPVTDYYAEHTFDYPGAKRRGGKRNKKLNRAYRIDLMTGTGWASYGIYGKNRKLRRRMYPSPEMLKNAAECLPF